MTKVTIYTRPFCGYCARALNLLREKNAVIEEIDAGFDPIKKSEMRKRSNGGNTFPQIFVGETHIGGCDELFALDSKGGLDALLAGDA